MTWEGLSPPYRTIVADPPWAYDEGFPQQSRTPGKWIGKVIVKRMAYSGMATEEIAALPVADLAGSDCRLFLWTTNRYLPHAFGVMSAWGFAYRQTLAWGKPCGIGGSVAPNAEFLLVGKRGTPGRIGRAQSAVMIMAPPKHHSRKPAAWSDLIETVSPGPYVELFCRQPRFGWDSWGHGYENFAEVAP